MTTLTTSADAIRAATSIARDVADGKLSPTDLEAQAVTELKELVGTVVGEGDPLWTLQCEIARQAVGLGALSPEALREWAAVLDRQRGVEPVEAVETAPRDDLPTPVSLASVDESHQESPADDDDAEPEPDAAVLQGVSVAGALAALASAAQQAHVEPDGHSVTPAPQRRTDGGAYDPLAGWNAGGSRRG